MLGFKGTVVTVSFSIRLVDELLIYIYSLIYSLLDSSIYLPVELDELGCT